MGRCYRHNGNPYIGKMASLYRGQQDTWQSGAILEIPYYLTVIAYQITGNTILCSTSPVLLAFGEENQLINRTFSELMMEQLPSPLSKCQGPLQDQCHLFRCGDFHYESLKTRRSPNQAIYHKAIKSSSKITVLSPNPGSELLCRLWQVSSLVFGPLQSIYLSRYPFQILQEYATAHMQLGTTAYKSAITATHLLLSREKHCSMQCLAQGHNEPGRVSNPGLDLDLDPTRYSHMMLITCPIILLTWFFTLQNTLKLIDWSSNPPLLCTLIEYFDVCHKILLFSS